MDKNEVISVLDNAIGCATDNETIKCLEEAKRCVEYCHTEAVDYCDIKTTEVIIDNYNNLMKCPHCNEVIGTAHDWTPNFCCECGGELTGGNGKGN